MTSGSYTESWTSTFTEARARVVMQKVLADLVALRVRGLLAGETPQRWYDDLTFLILRQAMARFQVQLRLPSGERLAVEYLVSDDGALHEDSDSGGIDYFALPTGTTASLTVRLREGCRAREEVNSHLAKRGWTFNGSLLEGAAARDRGYSKDGFGVVRSKIGEWP